MRMWRKHKSRSTGVDAISQSFGPTTGIRISRLVTEDQPILYHQPNPASSHKHTNNNNHIHLKSYESVGHSNRGFEMRLEDGMEMETRVVGRETISATTVISSESPTNSSVQSFSSCLGSLFEDSGHEASIFSPTTGEEADGHVCRCRHQPRPSVPSPPDESVDPVDRLTDGLDTRQQQTAVRVRGVNLSYREKLLNTLTGSSADQPVFVLNGISLTVPRSAIYGLLGPSGCGKTSLLRCIMGLIKPESGSIAVFGFKPGTPESGVPGPGVGFMPQEIALHNDLTIGEMLTYFGRLFFIPKFELDKRIDSLLQVLDLPERQRLISQLSGGQKRRVSFASALLHRPRLLILDEPTVGVDPVLREKIWNHLISLCESDGTSVIITTHYIEETRRAHVVGFMRKGVLLEEGSPDRIMRSFAATGLEDVFYKLCTVQKRDSLRPVTRDRLKILRRQSIRERKQLRFQLSRDDGDGDDDGRHSKDRSAYSFPQDTSPWSRSLSQLHALTAKYMVQTSRQPESIVGQFVLPIICLVMFCICIGGTPSNLKVAVVNQEEPAYLSTTLLNSMNPYILNQVSYSSLDQGLADVRSGKVWGVLHIRPNFSEAIIQRIFFDEEATNDTIDQSNVRLYADLTNKVLGITLDTVLVHTFEDFVARVLTELGMNPRIGAFPVQIGHTVYGQFSTSDFFGVRDFAAPGFLIVITFSVAYALTCLSLLVERLDDMFERNYSSGVSTTQIILSILCVRFVSVAIGTTLLLTLAVHLFEVPCRGSFAAVLVLLLLQSVAGMCMGLCVSAVVPDFFICAAASNGLLIFIFIISGVLWSLETLPYYIRWFSYVQPTTLPAESMRCMLTRGLPASHPAVWPGFCVSVLWILLLLLIASRIFKYQK